MEYAFGAAGLFLMSVAAYLWLRADPKKVNEDTDKFYNDLYRKDSRR